MQQIKWLSLRTFHYQEPNYLNSQATVYRRAGTFLGFFVAMSRDVSAIQSFLFRVRGWLTFFSP